ncbi:MAG: hypothetical protein ACM32O_15025 [Clostridia bacterium]
MRGLLESWLSLPLLLVSAGCGGLSPEEQARQTGLEFKRAQYVVEDYTKEERSLAIIMKRNERVKPFLTEKAYEGYLANREAEIPLLAATTQKRNIALKTITFEKQEATGQQEATLTFHYEMELELHQPDGVEPQLVKATGQMDVSKVGEQWLVSRDWDGYPLNAFWK